MTDMHSKRKIAGRQPCSVLFTNHACVGAEVSWDHDVDRDPWLQMGMGSKPEVGKAVLNPHSFGYEVSGARGLHESR